MSNDPNRPGQYPPPQWDSQPRQGAYPGVPAQPPANYRPPPQGYPSNPSTPGEMVTLPPPPHPGQAPHMYPPPHDMYAQYAHHPPPPPHMTYPSQPAPRQRTAIACRYCRRRKIRCSGFDASEDGRCTNCQRFQQECIFTPVSSQAQAFVPAHTAYPHLRQPGAMPPQRGGRPIYPQQGQPAIYGAHGQPLGPMHHDPNYPPHPYVMPPQGYPAPPYDDRAGPPPHGRPQDNVSLKHERSTDFHPSVPAPPRHGEPPRAFPPEGRLPADLLPPDLLTAAAPGSPSAGGVGEEEAPTQVPAFEYPDPTSLAPVSPTSSVQSYSAAPYPPQGQPYYPHAPPPPQQQQPPPPPPPQQGPVPPQGTPQGQQPPRRPTPEMGAAPSGYYEGHGSGSPHGSASSASAYPQYPPQGLHPPQVLPPNTDSRTPPPAGGRNSEGNGNGSAARGGMAVRDLLGPGGQSAEGNRSREDSSMVNALNKKM